MASNCMYIFLAVFLSGNIDFDLVECQNVTENPLCVAKQCSSKAKNGVCDSECNLKECLFDGLECTYGLNPWELCNNSTCSDNFGDGTCNPECDTELCLYDGFDCFYNGTPQANCAEQSNCINAYDDDNCNETCNTLICGFDGYDCHSEKGQTSKILGTIVINFFSGLGIALFHETKAIGYFLSTKSRSALYVKRHDNNLMEYKISNKNFKAYFEVDGRERCGFAEGKDCWTRVDTVANLISANLWKKAKTSKSADFSITSVSVCSYDGKYVPKCYRICNTGCKNQECNLERGFCDCIDNYVGPTCNMTCPGRCKVACSTEGDQPCIGSCKSGYLGTYCNETCQTGKWGDVCAYNCSKKCKNGVCSAETGFCTDGCLEGHSGQYCVVDCPSHYYGDQCKFKCGYCFLNITCESVTGTCSGGCGPGKQGDKCDKDCNNGTYGQGCSGTCDGCVNQQCVAATGVCLYGCISADRIGTLCKDPSEVGVIDPGLSVGIIVGVVISLLLIVAGLGSGIYIWRRSKANLFNVERTKRDDQKLADKINLGNEGINASTAELITDPPESNLPDPPMAVTDQQNEQLPEQSADLPPPPENLSALPSSDGLPDLPPPDDLPLPDDLPPADNLPLPDDMPPPPDDM